MCVCVFKNLSFLCNCLILEASSHWPTPTGDFSVTLKYYFKFHTHFDNFFIHNVIYYP